MFTTIFQVGASADMKTHFVSDACLNFVQMDLYDRFQGLQEKRAAVIRLDLGGMYRMNQEILKISSMGVTFEIPEDHAPCLRRFLGANMKRYRGYVKIYLPYCCICVASKELADFLAVLSF